MTEISDCNAFYGRYVTKKERAVPLHIARKIEKELCEESTKSRIALGNIERAHRALDILDIPRKQRNSPFPLSLAGRIRTVNYQPAISQWLVSGLKRLRNCQWPLQPRFLR